MRKYNNFTVHIHSVQRNLLMLDLFKCCPNQLPIPCWLSGITRIAPWSKVKINWLDSAARPTQSWEKTSHGDFKFWATLALKLIQNQEVHVYPEAFESILFVASYLSPLEEAVDVDEVLKIQKTKKDFNILMWGQFRTLVMFSI